MIMARTLKRKKPPVDKYGRVVISNWKGYPKDWDHLNQVSRETMIPMTSIIRSAVNSWLVQRGYTPLPEEEDAESKKS
jgi:hypothetical protein